MNKFFTAMIYMALLVVFLAGFGVYLSFLHYAILTIMEQGIEHWIEIFSLIVFSAPLLLVIGFVGQFFTEN